MKIRRSPENRHVSIGQRLRAARLRAGLSQLDVGARLGVSYQQINKYERGQTPLSAVAVLDLADLLQVDIRWMLGDQAATDEGPPVATSRLENRMLTAFARIEDQAARAAALGFVETLAQSVKVSS